MKCEHCGEGIRHASYGFEHKATASAFCWVGTGPQPEGVVTHQSTAFPASDGE